MATALGVLVAMWSASAGAAELSGEIVRISGPVEVRPLGEAAWRAATLMAVLHPGDMVRTGPGGAAEVALVHGVFRMDENTVIILPPPRVTPVAAGEDGALKVLLYRGRALFQIIRERLHGTFDVITPSVIVGVKGTTFGVEQRAVIGVVAFDGSVEVLPAARAGAVPVTVGAGQFTTLVQGRLTPPQPFQPGAPGAIWSGAPMVTQSRALAAPPAPPAQPASPAPPAPRSDVRSTGPGWAAPALAHMGPTPAGGFAPVPAAAFISRPTPPPIVSVGGSPVSNVATTGSTVGGTVGLVGASAALTPLADQDDGPEGLRGGKGKGGGKGKDKGKGRGKGKK